MDLRKIKSLIDLLERSSLSELEIVEGEEILFKAGDIIFLNTGEKHMTLNRSDNDFRYLEFFTCPPVTADFIEVK